MLKKIDMIRQYLLGNDEETNVDRFDMAWDINEYFWKLARHVKLGLAQNLEESLVKTLDQEWEVVNTVPKEYWAQRMAGIYILKRKWDVAPGVLQLGIQAQAQEFNRLCVCMKVPNEAYANIQDKLDHDFLTQITPTHTESYKWLNDSFYGEANSKDFHKTLLTKHGLGKALAYYVEVLMDFKEKYETLLDEVATKMVLNRVVK